MDVEGTDVKVPSLVRVIKEVERATEPKEVRLFLDAGTIPIERVDVSQLIEFQFEIRKKLDMDVKMITPSLLFSDLIIPFGTLYVPIPIEEMGKIFQQYFIIDLLREELAKLGEGKYVGISIEGKILASADDDLQLLQELDTIKYPASEIFLHRVGARPFAGWI